MRFKLNDTQLIETFLVAVDLKLDRDFLSLLKNEIERRGYDIEGNIIIGSISIDPG